MSDETYAPLLPYHASAETHAQLRFQARIATVRTLIRRGDLDPYDGLALVIHPTDAMLEAEACLSAQACYRRARRDAA